MNMPPMNDDFPGSVPSGKSKKIDYKKIATEQSAPAFDLIKFGWWCLVKHPVSTVVIGLGAISAVTGVGPFVMGVFGFAVSQNAHPTQAVMNSAGLYLVRPVSTGIGAAFMEPAFREQNQLANPNNGGTLTPTQVRALQGLNSTRVLYVTNKQAKR